MIIFDIETGPLSDEQISWLVDEFQPPEHPGEFDASQVKTGNLKDADKIQAKIESERKKHQLAVANHEQNVEQLRDAWWSDIVSRAALCPTTGQVLAIGYKSARGSAIQTILDTESDEAALINLFWTRYRDCRQQGRRMVGHNIFGFDLPFLVRRSWILGVDVPETVIEQNRYWDKRVFVDTMQVWGCGSYRDWIKLDVLSKLFGCNGKPNDVDGGMFSSLFFGTPDEHQKAIDYLKCDLELTATVAAKLGVA